MEEDAVWAVFLSCHCTRKEELWALGVEHSLRVQRVRPQDQCPAATGAHGTSDTCGSTLYIIVKVYCNTHHPPPNQFLPYVRTYIRMYMYCSCMHCTYVRLWHSTYTPHILNTATTTPHTPLTSSTPLPPPPHVHPSFPQPSYHDPTYTPPIFSYHHHPTYVHPLHPQHDYHYHPCVCCTSCCSADVPE